MMARNLSVLCIVFVSYGKNNDNHNEYRVECKKTGMSLTGSTNHAITTMSTVSSSFRVDESWTGSCPDFQPSWIASCRWS